MSNRGENAGNGTDRRANARRSTECIRRASASVRIQNGNWKTFDVERWKLLDGD
jgi:hypothetical protein